MSKDIYGLILIVISIIVLIWVEHSFRHLGDHAVHGTTNPAKRYKPIPPYKSEDRAPTISPNDEVPNGR